VDRQTATTRRLLRSEDTDEDSSGSSENDKPAYGVDGNGMSEKGKKESIVDSYGTRRTSSGPRATDGSNFERFDGNDADQTRKKLASKRNAASFSNSSLSTNAVFPQMGTNSSHVSALLRDPSSTTDLSGKTYRPRFGCHLLPLPATTDAVEGDDEYDSDENTTDRLPSIKCDTQAVSTRTVSNRSSMCYDDASRALISVTEARACPMAKALADRKRAVVEWQSMAAVLDRLLFWIFLVATFIAYIVILVIVPALKPSRLSSQYSDN